MSYNNITILGEDRFYWEKDGDNIVVNHPKWSVVGISNTLFGAIDNAIDEALIIKDSYVDEPDENLSVEAQKLKYWLVPIKKKRFN